MSTGVYQKTAGDVIRAALRDASITGISLPVEAEDFQVGSDALNDVLAWLQTKQIHLWSETEALLPLNPDQRQYLLPGAHCFTDYVYTTTTAGYLAAETTFDVVSTAGMTVGDFIGFELADGTRWWSTIGVINSATSIDTDDAAPSTISSGATIYAYTTAIDQPVRILDARYADGHDRDEIPTRQQARQEYYRQPSKSDRGAANSWYYSRQLSTGELNLWPVAATCREVLRFTFIKPQYIPTDQSDDILVPPEWYLPLKNKVAAELGVTYAIDPNKQVVLEQKAANFVEDALGTDNDFAGFSFYPEDC